MLQAHVTIGPKQRCQNGAYTGRLLQLPLPAHCRSLLVCRCRSSNAAMRADFKAQDATLCIACKPSASAGAACLPHASAGAADRRWPPCWHHPPAVVCNSSHPAMCACCDFQSPRHAGSIATADQLPLLHAQALAFKACQGSLQALAAEGSHFFSCTVLWLERP